MELSDMQKSLELIDTAFGFAESPARFCNELTGLFYSADMICSRASPRLIMPFSVMIAVIRL